MSNSIKSFGPKMFFVLLAAVAALTHSISAQPTAIGPSVNTTQAGELSYFTLKVGVQAKTLDIINQVNQTLAQQGQSVSVSLKEIKGFRPRRTDTVFQIGQTVPSSEPHSS